MDWQIGDLDQVALVLELALVLEMALVLEPERLQRLHLDSLVADLELDWLALD